MMTFFVYLTVEYLYNTCISKYITTVHNFPQSSVLPSMLSYANAI